MVSQQPTPSNSPGGRRRGRNQRPQGAAGAGDQSQHLAQVVRPAVAIPHQGHPLLATRLDDRIAGPLRGSAQRSHPAANGQTPSPTPSTAPIPRRGCCTSEHRSVCTHRDRHHAAVGRPHGPRGVDRVLRPCCAGIHAFPVSLCAQVQGRGGGGGGGAHPPREGHPEEKGTGCCWVNSRAPESPTISLALPLITSGLHSASIVSTAAFRKVVAP